MCAASSRVLGHRIIRHIALFLFSFSLLVSGAATAAPIFQDLGNGVILDTNTNLQWEQNANHGQFDWFDANSYAAALALAGGGWTLPGINQLQQLYDDISAQTGCADCTGNQDLFTGIQPFYWSSTEVDANNAWSFVMGIGIQLEDDKFSQLWAWAVRPAPEPGTLLLFAAAGLAVGLGRRNWRQH